MKTKYAENISELLREMSNSKEGDIIILGKPKKERLLKEIEVEGL